MISVSVEGADRLIIDLKGVSGQIAQALVRAMNRSISSARTVMVREIAADAGLKQKDVRDALRMQNATFARPEASLAASLKRIPLIQFGATGPEPSRGRGRGVAYRLGSQRSLLSHAFIATMPTGHRGVFARGNKRQRGSGRLPISEKFGPSLGHIFAKYQSLGLARAEEVFMANFDHEVTFLSGGTSPVGAEQDAGGAD